MSDLLAAIWLVGAVVGVIGWCVAICYAIADWLDVPASSRRQRQEEARFVLGVASTLFLIPIWPIALVVGCMIGLVLLVRDAVGGGKR